MTKEQFLESIREGKWFQVFNRYGHVFALKMKIVTLKDNTSFIQSLWLSYQDQEAMCFAEYGDKDWKWENDTFIHQSSGIFHFGSPTPGADSIYDEETGVLVEERLKKEIFDYAEEDFLTEAEFQDIWWKLKERKDLGFEVLSYQ